MEELDRDIIIVEGDTKNVSSSINQIPGVYH